MQFCVTYTSCDSSNAKRHPCMFINPTNKCIKNDVFKSLCSLKTWFPCSKVCSFSWKLTHTHLSECFRQEFPFHTIPLNSISQDVTKFKYTGSYREDENMRIISPDQIPFPLSPRPQFFNKNPQCNMYRIYMKKEN